MEYEWKQGYIKSIWGGEYDLVTSYSYLENNNAINNLSDPSLSHNITVVDCRIVSSAPVSNSVSTFGFPGYKHLMPKGDTILVIIMTN